MILRIQLLNKIIDKKILIIQELFKLNFIYLDFVI